MSRINIEEELETIKKANEAMSFKAAGGNNWKL
jgi:hypothetical protein